ncbi:MAG: DUF4249 family protein [Bacteroidales bacterium]|nr:DUF4249 family protein [Bacteroidales bacterium]
MRSRTILIFLLLACLIVSCEKELDIKNLNYKPMIVLNGLIYQDSIIVINVASTKSIIEPDTSITFLENAVVKLYRGDSFMENLVYDSLGFFHSTHRAEDHSEYRIVASAEGMEDAIASFSINSPADFGLRNFNSSIHDTILHIDIPEEADTNLTHISLGFELHFRDDPDKENFYDYSSFDSCYSYGHMSSYYGDSLIEEGYRLHRNSRVGLFFTNQEDAEIFGTNYSMNNGYCQNCFITDEFFSGKELSFELQANFYTTTPDTVDILLYSYPSDYNKYHQSGYRYRNVQDNPFSQPVNIYSNVENGLGLVCGVSCGKQKIAISDEGASLINE